MTTSFNNCFVLTQIISKEAKSKLFHNRCIKESNQCTKQTCPYIFHVSPWASCKGSFRPAERLQKVSNPDPSDSLQIILTVLFYLKCTGCYSVSNLRMRLILNPGMTEENDELEPYLTDANINRVKSIIKKYNNESK